MGFETGASCLYVEKDDEHGPVFEFLVPDVEAAKRRLVDAGCTIVEENASVPRCYVRDPHGVVFNFQCSSGTGFHCLANCRATSCSGMSGHGSTPAASCRASTRWLPERSSESRTRSGLLRRHGASAALMAVMLHLLSVWKMPALTLPFALVVWLFVLASSHFPRLRPGAAA